MPAASANIIYRLRDGANRQLRRHVKPFASGPPLFKKMMSVTLNLLCLIGGQLDQVSSQLPERPTRQSDGRRILGMRQDRQAA
jgi:hypothetical protein